MEAFGSTNALVTMEKMESGELPPSPFSGGHSWDIDFGGFTKIETENEKQAKEYNAKESPIDVMISAFFEGYNYISPQKSTPRKWLARLGGCAIILTLVVWMSAIIGWKNEVHVSLRIIRPQAASRVTTTRSTWTPEKPIGGIIATHHRTGTVLFQSLADRLCDVYTVDFERIAGPVSLKKINAVEPIVYKSFFESTKRLAVGMHGFKEECSSAPSRDMCDLFDHQCWMQQCQLDFSNEEEAAPPVAHVVRNPKNLIISAYLYHRQDPPPEDWLREAKPEALGYFSAEMQNKYANTSFYEVLREVPPEEGLLMEFVVNSEDIYRAARNHRDMVPKAWALNVKYEDILSDYDAIMLRIIRHIKTFNAHSEDNVVKLAKGFDLKSMSESDRTAFNVDLHITSTDERKEHLWNILSGQSDLAVLLSAIASSMGYAE